MINQPTNAADFTLRIKTLCHVLYDVCRCHIFTDPRHRCSRCDILTSAATEWAYEYELVMESYNEQKDKTV